MGKPAARASAAVSRDTATGSTVVNSSTPTGVRWVPPGRTRGRSHRRKSAVTVPAAIASRVGLRICTCHILACRPAAAVHRHLDWTDVQNSEEGWLNADERRFAVLRAIVADYVSTQEPVGSKMIVDRHNLGVSSATVRNDMAVLEEDGLIAQPHTSAGRVPTDKGYRLFVDRLAQVKPLSAAERRAVQAFLDGAVDLDDVLRRSVRLLAQLTRQVAVVQYPTLTRSTVRHCEVVALTPARLMLVLITDSGRVDQRVVDLGQVLADEDVAQVRDTAQRRAGRAAARGGVGRGRRAARDRPGGAARGAHHGGHGAHRDARRAPGGAAACSAARPTSPATPPTSPARCARCWRRWRSRSWC